jgi:hypothetical protein
MPIGSTENKQRDFTPDCRMESGKERSSLMELYGMDILEVGDG